MTVSSAGGADQVCTVGTEHTLLDVNTVGVYELGFDAFPVADLDYFEVRIKKIYKTGGSLRVAYFATVYDAQSVEDLGKQFPPVSNFLTDSPSLRFTLKQTKGTSRTITWHVAKHA